MAFARSSKMQIFRTLPGPNGIFDWRGKQRIPWLHRVGDFDVGLHFNRFAVEQVRLPLPLLHRVHRALVKVLAHALADFDVFHHAILADHHRQVNRPSDPGLVGLGFGLFFRREDRLNLLHNIQARHLDVEALRIRCGILRAGLVDLHVQRNGRGAGSARQHGAGRGDGDAAGGFQRKAFAGRFMTLLSKMLASKIPMA